MKNFSLPLAVLLTSLLSAACGGDNPAAAAQRAGRPPASVRVMPVEQGAFDVAIRIVGRLRAESAADLFARVEGPLTAVLAGTGDRVRKGQLLARIDPSEAEQRIQQLRAALRMAEATLGQRRAELEVASSQAARSRKLFAEELLSESDYDIAQGELLTARSQLQLAQAQIEQARANLGAAQIQLDQTRIVAPFDGWIGTRHLDLGAHATTNRPIFSIVDLSTIRTTISLPAQEAVHIRRGQSAAVIADVMPDRTFNGIVSRVSSVFDPQTNTVEAEVEVPNGDAALRPGMFASVSISYRTNPTALLVPLSAVSRNEHEEWLFVAEPSAEGDGLVARRVLVRALQSADRSQQRVAVEPREGNLAAGTNVIVLGHEGLRDGDRVTASDGEAKGSGS
ncbi:MAG TPA: efflux RND transporter periplasmic adaptor subunit [Thermoanaerobaculia bacterium]|nr:efflux RND transporter periplasmic adaptor subunit [Thermoanaerobaculia bacterium]